RCLDRLLAIGFKKRVTQTSVALDLPRQFGDVDREQPLDGGSRRKVGEDRLPQRLVVVEASAVQQQGRRCQYLKLDRQCGCGQLVCCWEGPVHRGEASAPSVAGGGATIAALADACTGL